MNIFESRGLKTFNIKEINGVELFALLGFISVMFTIGYIVADLMDIVYHK